MFGGERIFPGLGFGKKIAAAQVFLGITGP
jgi:hypothetical protein